MSGWYNMWDGGNQYSAWVSYLSFFRHVAKLGLKIYETFDHYEKAAMHSGPRIMTPDFCMVSDRPEILTVDEQNRPHNETGPYCRWRDGFSLWYWHGVKVTQQIIETPETLTVAQIEKEENAEVRRVMITRYGQVKYLKDSGAVKIHSDDWGTLWRKDIVNDEPLMMVEVLNSTPEADGTFKTYFLRVAPDLKPLPPGTWAPEKQRDWLAKQRPQELTARNAIASLAGKRGPEYAPLVET